MKRRQFLPCLTALGGFSAIRSSTLGAERDGRPPVRLPRATAGDSVSEPDWKERLTVTVGHGSGGKADFSGDSERVIQAAVDYVARLGGGTVRILPGAFLFRNAVYLSSDVRVIGSGEDTILKKNPSVSTTLAADSDWFDQEVTLKNADEFRVGDGVCLQTENPHSGAKDVLKRTLIARTGNRFKLDKALRKNFWTMKEPSVANLFPLFSGEFIDDVVIENLTLDGNKSNNENLNGNHAGCIFLQDCNRITMREVEAHSYNGDGMSWQICHDVIVENCHSHDNVGLGLHPGSGSQRPLIRNNRLEKNKIGIFFCWGVRNGLAEKNRIHANDFGISIGHRDTDNLIRDNDVISSEKVGIIFRPERGKAFAPHRNLVTGNRIVNSGPKDGVAIDVQGEVESITLEKNEIRETRAPEKRIGVRIGKSTKDIKLSENKIDGFSQDVLDLH